jgi:hypothetical protein
MSLRLMQMIGALHCLLTRRVISRTSDSGILGSNHGIRRRQFERLVFNGKFREFLKLEFMQ